jgi:hypothetical protein
MSSLQANEGYEEYIAAGGFALPGGYMDLSFV